MVMEKKQPTYGACAEPNTSHGKGHRGQGQAYSFNGRPKIRKVAYIVFPPKNLMIRTSYAINLAMATPTQDSCRPY